MIPFSYAKEEKLFLKVSVLYLMAEIQSPSLSAYRWNLVSGIDLLAILQQRLDRALFLYVFIRDVQPSGVRSSISIVQNRKFDKMQQNTVRF